MRFLGGFATGSQSGMINKVAITSANCIIPLINGIDSGNFNLNKLNFKKLDFSQFKIQYRYINKEDLRFKF